MLTARQFICHSSPPPAADPPKRSEYPIRNPQQKGNEIAQSICSRLKWSRTDDAQGVGIGHPSGGRHPRPGQQPNGFPEEGAWMPLSPGQVRSQQDREAFRVSGDFMPMVANDGPHYGDNVKLAGPGKYKVKFTILPPSETSTPLRPPPTGPPASVLVQALRRWNTSSPTSASARRAGTDMNASPLIAALVAAGLVTPTIAAPPDPALLEN